MRIIIYFLAILILINGVIYSNENTNKIEYAKHAIFFELLGQGLTFSINYEYKFHPNFTFRIGINFFNINPMNIIIFPITYNFLIFGESIHNIEIGGGGAFFF